MDMTIRDNEDRGFYMETFHSSAWIYQGDDGGSGAIPPSLNTRTRAVSSKTEKKHYSFHLETLKFQSFSTSVMNPELTRPWARNNVSQYTVAPAHLTVIMSFRL